MSKNTRISLQWVFSEIGNRVLIGFHAALSALELFEGSQAQARYLRRHFLRMVDVQIESVLSRAIKKQPVI